MKQKEVSRLILRFQACGSLCLIVPFSKTFRGEGRRRDQKLSSRLGSTAGISWVEARDAAQCF